MKYLKFLNAFAWGLLSLAFFSLALSTALGINFFAVFAVLIVLSFFTYAPKGAAYDVFTQVWAKYIMERFWKDNAFLKNAFDDSQYVLQGRIVHIPQPGAKPNVVINRADFPAVAVRRTDTDVLYPLDEYTTDPTHIPNIETVDITYNKQDSVLGDHMYVLDEAVADNMLAKWAANSTNYKTTGAQIVNGAPSVLQVGPSTGQTGNRLAFTHRDLKNLMTKMNVNNVPKQDRFVLIDDNMFDAFYDTLGETNAKDFSRFMDAENGVIGKLHGFSIMTRSSILAADNTDAIKAVGSALAATDNLVSLAWQKNTVAFAIGDKKLFQRKDDPLYYGDVYSALVMAGGRVRRGDGLGVYTIEQGTPA